MMKKEDLEIICHIRNNCRTKITKVAKKVGMPASTVYEKIRNDAGIISKYACLLNFEKLGMPARVYFVIKADKTLKDPLRTFLDNQFFINNFWKINNGYDFMFEAVFRDMNDVELFKDLIEARFKIKNLHMFYIIQSIKTEKFMTDKSHIELLKSFSNDLFSRRKGEKHA